MTSNAPLHGNEPHHYDPHSFFDRVILAYGFRPFFILSALYGALTVLIWAAFWYGLVPLPEAIPTAEWHAHEMIFGFATAALAGFLLTAVPEWTLTPPRTGRWVALVVALWLAGRLTMLAAGVLPMELVAVVNLSLLPLLMAWTLPQIWAERLKRHRSFTAFLPALWLMQVVTYLGWLGWVEPQGWDELLSMRALNAGLLLFLVAVSLVVTRVSMVLVPLALEEQGDEESIFRPLPPRRNLAAATLIFFTIADFFSPGNAITGWIALAAAVAQLDRMADWHVGRVLMKPYVLVIYLSHVWLALGLAGLGFDALFGWDFFAASRHALGMGAASLAVMAVFVIAGLRHTGHEVVVAPPVLLAIVFLNLATALRVFIPSLLPEHYLHLAIGVSSLLWAAAFALFLVSFWGLLTRPRADGEPG